MPINVAIVGTGLVGSRFLKMLQQVSEDIAAEVVLITRSSGALVSKDCSALDLSQVNIDSLPDKACSPDDILNILKQLPNHCVLIDNTSSEVWANSYPQFIANNISIVTPNKKAFSGSLNLWNEIFGQKTNALVYHEATVGAGLPVISTIKDLLNTGDKIERIEGVLSGTLSYIFNEFGTTTDAFSSIVMKAKQLGFTEPDPREDLNGLDVARKVTILARLAGGRIASPSSFPVESLIPEPLRFVNSPEEFLQKLPQFDEVMSKLRDDAKSEGRVLRFVGSVVFTQSGATCKVGIERYDNSHPFASLKGSDNILSIKSERYPSPLTIQGAGAGDAVTAMGVLADLIRVSERRS